MATRPSLSYDELFEAWVLALPDTRRERLAEHIALARRGPVWMRRWLPSVPADTHIMIIMTMSDQPPHPTD